MIDKKIAAGLLGAVGASLCCITPVVAVLAGSSSLASSFSFLEPFRPYLVALTLLVLAYAWWDKLRTKEPELECACETEDVKTSFFYSTKFLAGVTVFALVMLSFPYWGDALIRPNQQNLSKEITYKMADIKIEGMTCKACEATVESVAAKIDGLGHIQASAVNKNAVVLYDPTKTSPDEIAKTIAKTGYKPVAYTDESGEHPLQLQALPIDHAPKAKCGSGKCGAGKCGSGKCGDTN